MEVMAQNSTNALCDRQNRRGVLEVGTLDALLAQNKIMNQQIATQT